MKHCASFFSVLPVLLSVLLIPEASLAQIDREAGNMISTRSEVIAQRGMVATSQPLATQVGLQILKNGGNAIDAAIGANAAMGLMEPTGNGIGGDLFAIIWHEESEQVYALNASGRSPRGLSYDELMDILEEKGEDDIPPYDLLSVSVPGAVDGWFTMHERFGSADMEDILAEPIWYAENGFPVSEAISASWRRSVPFLKDQPGAFEETFAIDGEGPEKGEIFKNPDLGNTFRLLASEGRDAFYRGEIAEKIDTWMKENGGYLRYEDFDQHESEWVEPQTINYRGYDVYQMGGNVQGTAVLQMLNILEGFDLSETGFATAETYHLFIEAKKLAFEDRAKHYADPTFHEVPYDVLLSKEYATERRKLIGDTAREDLTTGVDVLEDGDTIYLTTADKNGNMVSLIQSNFRGMGTGFVVPGTGFSFQNRGELFSLDPNHPNVYAPGKRPFHTIIPGFVMKDGEPFMTLGNMGGAYQPMGHVSLITNVIDFGMNMQQAGDALRWEHSGSTQPTDDVDDHLTDVGLVSIESSIDYQVVRDLEAMGHDVQIGHSFFGRFQAIMRDLETGVYYGASESRVDGQAAGY
ncbi:gamma-glutamyltransferase [Gracilimonas mengyeensis]|uniref:Glutathione hydrolase proenzyme n=1 Tax=Gracilimonas mengyeensis TaxID=1302730 RepID=A0A521DHS2_9BACT|nr:gamma-glutamyltransferase [Gracilimonas mengyeensis]SMO71122.1 gamma-glutamyltransferase 2. Threonine peptidase. MEROPS family T03 [Gracilimonas mengyeensis]